MHFLCTTFSNRTTHNALPYLKKRRKKNKKTHTCLELIVFLIVNFPSFLTLCFVCLVFSPVEKCMSSMQMGTQMVKLRGSSKGLVRFFYLDEHKSCIRWRPSRKNEKAKSECRFPWDHNVFTPAFALQIYGENMQHFIPFFSFIFFSFRNFDISFSLDKIDWVGASTTANKGISQSIW